MDVDADVAHSAGIYAGSKKMDEDVTKKDSGPRLLVTDEDVPMYDPSPGCSTHLVGSQGTKAPLLFLPIA